MSLGQIIFIAAIISLFFGFYYFSLVISIAIWFPRNAKRKWVELTESPGIDAFKWFWKWVAPVWLIAVTVSILFVAIRLAFML